MQSIEACPMSYFQPLQRRMMCFIQGSLFKINWINVSEIQNETSSKFASIESKISSILGGFMKWPFIFQFENQWHSQRENRKIKSQM